MNGIILAGGLSSRMGQDKASLPWGDSDLLHAVLERLAPVCRKLIVVSNTVRDIRLPDVTVVADHYTLCGPLGGLHAGLTPSDADYNFIAACDMPYLNTHVVAFIREAAEHYDAAVPYIDGHYNPLHAVYRQTCLPYIDQMLQDSNYRILNFYSQIKMRHITVEELVQFDPDLMTLSNANTPDDYRELKTRRGGVAATGGK